MLNHPLIFVHIPKTAGTSFRTGLEKIFLKERLAYDYGLHESLTSASIREFVYEEDNILKAKEWMFSNEISALTGHFYAPKYLPYFDINFFCTFLRDPIQRVISDYKHFVRHYEYKENLKVFANEEYFRNRQSKFLSSLPLHQIGFLGITERYTESLNLFQTTFGVAVPQEYTNIARHNLDIQHIEDKDTVSFIEEINQEDMLLYRQALEEFENRCRKQQLYAKNMLHRKD